MAEKKKPAVVFSNPYFKLLLIINTIVCLVGFLGLVTLSLFAPDPLTKAQERLLERSGYFCMTTVGLFVGLLGGRAATPDRTP